MMIWIDSVMLILVLTNLILLGSNRMSFCIRVVAFQGIAIGCLPIFRHISDLGMHALLLAAIALLLKGFVFPWLLLRALRDADVRQEVEPFVNYTLSILTGVVSFGILLWLGNQIEMPVPSPSTLVLPTSFFTVLAGLFLIITRKKALTQVLGYLVMENGIYTFGAMLAYEQPWLVEMGVLLDVFVAVFVMGIIVFHISREFDHMDTSRLAHLRDWKQKKKPTPETKKSYQEKEANV